MNIQLRKLRLLIQHFMIVQLRHTTFITQSLKEIHSGRETGLIDTGPLLRFCIHDEAKYVSREIQVICGLYPRSIFSLDEPRVRANIIPNILLVLKHKYFLILRNVSLQGKNQSPINLL